MNSVTRLIRVSLRYGKRVGLTYSLMVALCEGKKDSMKKIENPQTLTHEFLIRQASSVAANSATQLLTQTVVALLDTAEQYKKALNDFMSLMEEGKELLGNNAAQQDLSDLMIEARAKINDLKKQFVDMSSLLDYVEKVAVSTAETSFLAGEEFISSSLSERLYSALEQVKETKRVISNLESECLVLQKEHITEVAEFEKKKGKKNVLN